MKRARSRGIVPIVAASLVLILLSPGSAVAAATTSQAANPVVFILDASGSMVREVSSGVTRMDVAKEALTDTIAELPSGTPTGLLVFGTGTGNDESERAAGCQDVVELAGVSPVDAAALGAAVADVTASGFTPISPALRQAVAMLPADEPGSIVLISDGVDTCAPPASCEVASQVHRDNPALSIHVVAFGVDDDEAAQQQMTCIGGVGGGTAVTASDADQLAARLRAASVTTDTTGTLTTRGMNGVDIGMTLAEVRRAVDGADVGEPQMRDGVEIVYVDCGWGTVELHRGRVVAITASDAASPTAEGVAPGDAVTEADAIYGEPVDHGTAGGVSRVYQAHRGSPVGYRMFVEDSRITRIVLCRCVPASLLSADPSTWEVSFDGVGPLELGMTLADARAAIPGLAPAADGSWVVPDRHGGAAVTVGMVDDTIALIRVGPSSSDEMTTTSDSAPHARGIRLGSSSLTVENALPGGSVSSVYIADDSDYLLADRHGRVMTFRFRYIHELNQDAVASFSVEDAPRLLALDPYDAPRWSW